MIDNKGKLFGKVSLVDLLIILLVAVALIATVYKFNFSPHGDVNESNIKIEYVLKIEGIRNYTVESIEIGDELYDSQSGDFIGSVTAVETAPAKDFVLMDNGDIRYAQMPERYDAYVTVESGARTIGGFYYANGQREINKFSNIEIESQDFACTAEVQSVAEKN